MGLPSLGQGHWWTPLSAVLWAPGPGGYLAITLLSLLILAPAEQRTGTTRTFATLLVCQTAGLLAAVGLVELAALAHQPWLNDLASQTSVGALPGMLGVGFALSGSLTPLWRGRLRLLLTTAAAIGLIYIGQLEQVALACVAAVSLAAVALTYSRAWPWARPRRLQHDTRALVGVLVAVPALGAILAGLIPNSRGLLSLSSLPPVQAGPALLLLLCAYGLRRGRRLAWWLAVVSNLTLLAVSLWAAHTADSAPSAHMARLHTWARVILPAEEAVVLSVVTLMLLLATRRRFDQTSDGRAVRKLTVTLVAAVGASGGASLMLGYLLPDGSSTRPDSAGPARDLPMRLLAGLLFGHRFLPATLVGRVLYAGVFLGFWVVALSALTAFFLHTTRAPDDPDASDRARAILTRGGSTLSYMSTWPGNAYWFSADGRAAIAYRAIVGVALTVGEPYGDPAAFESAITEFARFCRHRGLQPCLYSVTSRARDATQRLGWQSVQIAEDTLLPLAGLQFSGKKWQGVRAALNKAAREGITAEWWSYAEMPLDLLGQIEEISGKWMVDKGLPEMNFMLGGLGELNDPNVRCLIAVGADRKLHAVTSWMPVYDGGRSIGWTIDLMRRNTEGTVRGVMEFLIATAALTFQEEGARFVSLSGAPLTGINASDEGGQPCALQRALGLIAVAMEPAYGFRSLRTFKDKFQPAYKPLYLTYPDPAALGPIAFAIGCAYLPRLTSRDGLRLLARMRRPQAGRGRAKPRLTTALPARSGERADGEVGPAGALQDGAGDEARAG